MIVVNDQAVGGMVQDVYSSGARDAGKLELRDYEGLHYGPGWMKGTNVEIRWPTQFSIEGQTRLSLSENPC